MLIVAAAVFAALLVLLLIFGPREPALLETPEVTLPEDLQAWLDDRETVARPGLEAHIDWAGEPDEQTDIALIYIHGFSGSPVEMRPMPEQVAARLGANLFLQRLTGHGQDGAAMGEMRADDWWRDMAEAVAIGHRLGRKVVLIGTSTGGTLVAEAARDPILGPQIDGVVLVSPNFAIRQFGVRLLDLPFARTWVPWVLGPERCFDVVNPAHSEGWTSCYPNTALLPMSALLRHARQGDFGAATQPALFIWSDNDLVVDYSASQRVADGWGGSVTIFNVHPGPQDDPAGHVIAGDTLSPDLTPVISAEISDWVLGELGD